MKVRVFNTIAIPIRRVAEAEPLAVKESSLGHLQLVCLRLEWSQHKFLLTYGVAVP